METPEIKEITVQLPLLNTARRDIIKKLAWVMFNTHEKSQQQFYGAIVDQLCGSIAGGFEYLEEVLSHFPKQSNETDWLSLGDAQVNPITMLQIGMKERIPITKLLVVQEGGDDGQA